jgi:hypothetical protein
MIPTSSLRFVDDPAEIADAITPETEPAPQVFVRTLTAPPGWPWEQRRNIELEARHGAPLPIGELVYRVRRLEPWRSGAGSRFAVFYVAARDVPGQLEATADVDGRPLSVTFSTGAGLTGQAGRALARSLFLGVAAVLILTSIGAAVAQRAETDAKLSLVEQRAAARLRAAEGRDHVRMQARMLDNVPERGPTLADVAADLAWASNAKRADVRLEGLHWDRGLMGLEVRAESSPFEGLIDRPMRRSAHAVRPGVWLWAVGGARGADGPSPGAVR